MADKDPYCGKTGVVPVGRNVSRDPGALVAAIFLGEILLFDVNFRSKISRRPMPLGL